MSERDMWIGEIGRNGNTPKIWDYKNNLGNEIFVVPVIQDILGVVKEQNLAANNLEATGKTFDDMAPRSWLKY